ncbi:MAG TPA: PIN domain-containing protein [Terriglobales bacterium]|nr:PIN domain-containing protein [Terriglobales bacterium]
MRTYTFDASALWAFLQRGKAAARVAGLLNEGMHGRVEILMSAVNFGEVYALIVREQGTDRARTIIGGLRRLPIRVVDATMQHCCQAAEVKVRHKIAYADAFAAALTIENKATLVTSDSDFRRLGHNFPVLWLKP